MLALTRTRLLDKLATLPLGTVLDRSSGSYKNIIVERVDSIETTLAHLLPEMTANIVGALAVLVLLFLEDWRMGLAMLIVVPLGILCFMSMFSGYNEKFQRTVTSTKALNDTAVEYISGIEVIKAFGQSKTSYAKFVSAAKEGADCFIDWMRGSLFGQVAGMAIFPSTLLVIAHRLSTIADADQIIVVNHGRIEATGTQAELLASCPLYKTMWEAHISVKDAGEVA